MEFSVQGFHSALLSRHGACRRFPQLSTQIRLFLSRARATIFKASCGSMTFSVFLLIVDIFCGVEIKLGSMNRLSHQKKEIRRSKGF